MSYIMDERIEYKYIIWGETNGIASKAAISKFAGERFK